MTKCFEFSAGYLLFWSPHTHCDKVLTTPSHIASNCNSASIRAQAISAKTEERAETESRAGFAKADQASLKGSSVFRFVVHEAHNPSPSAASKRLLASMRAVTAW